MQDSIIEFSVSDFVSVFNQTINYAYPQVVIVGEVSNFSISKNTWLFFNLRDENSSVKFFGSILKLPAPIEDGMMLKVMAVPQLHPKFGFSLQIQSIQLFGAGTIKRANSLLQNKLEREGIFDKSRKRALPPSPNRIGLITSSESAAYGDFIKVLNHRWCGVEVIHFETSVQGEHSALKIADAINKANSQIPDLEVIVITRGGGSNDDLQAFNDEQLVRAIAGSKIPTLVAVGHERDYTFAELAADRRASTPSNAAEVLVPDKRTELFSIKNIQESINTILDNVFFDIKHEIEDTTISLSTLCSNLFHNEQAQILIKEQLLRSLDPVKILDRGYAIISKDGLSIRSVSKLNLGDSINIKLADGIVMAEINDIKVK